MEFFCPQVPALGKRVIVIGKLARLGHCDPRAFKFLILELQIFDLL